MRGDIPLLPQYALVVRCSIKAQGQLYLLPMGGGGWAVDLNLQQLISLILTLTTRPPGRSTTVHIYVIHGKLKLSPCLTKHLAIKTYWESRGIDPRILKLKTRCSYFLYHSAGSRMELTPDGATCSNVLTPTIQHPNDPVSFFACNFPRSMCALFLSYTATSNCARPCLVKVILFTKIIFLSNNIGLTITPSLIQE
jgi:hypothetical protein